MYFLYCESNMLILNVPIAATYYSAGGVVPAAPGFGRGNYGDVMSPTYFGSVYGRSGDAYGGCKYYYHLL